MIDVGTSESAADGSGANASGRSRPRFRVWVALVCAAAVLGAPGAALAAKDPILFVHGWSRNASDWDTMIDRFKADGWTDDELYAFSYNTGASNKTTAEQEVETRVDDILDSTEASKVDIITHSMGGLSSRWYIKFLDGDSKVDDWVSLGGPNHGTQSAYFCFTTSCVEMRPGSSFLQDLNAGDETPGNVNYGTWWSPCDSIISPSESTILDGATNTETACIGHFALLSDVTVYEQVRDFVE